MLRLHVAASCVLLLAAGCEKAPEKVEPPSVGEAFPSVLLPPNAKVESRSGSADALQLVFQSASEPDYVAGYYRTQFSQPGWSIVSDLTDSTGTVAMHVNWTATGQPMWVRLVPNAAGTRVELTGAVPTRDTSYVRRSTAAKDSSNTLTPR